MRLKCILNAPAQLESGDYSRSLVLRDSLLCSLCRERFLEVADWLTVQWSLVVKSWALTEVVVWLKFEVGAVGAGHCSKINF